MERRNKDEDIPLNLKRRIAENGKAMQDFYSKTTDERQRVLDKISETNKLIDERK